MVSFPYREAPGALPWRASLPSSPSGPCGVAAGIGALGHPVAGADLHIGRHALKPSQHIIYNSNNDFLHCDSHGSGPNPQTCFATTGADLALTNTDFLVEA
jgi:hypothetical protein